MRTFVAGAGLVAALAVSLVVPVTAFGDSPIGPGGRRCLAVAGSPGDAAMVNLTPVLAGGQGHALLVSSDVSAAPTASSVNYSIGTVDPNVAIAPIGADGRVCVENARLTSVHLVADHLGTIDADAYRPATSSGAPKRVLDSRQTDSPIGPGGRRCLAVAGSPGDAAMVNLTPVLAGGQGHALLVSSDVSAAPTASSVNYSIGTVDPNVAIAPIGADGRVCVENARLTSVHLVADHLGTIDADRVSTCHELGRTQACSRHPPDGFSDWSGWSALFGCCWFAG